MGKIMKVARLVLAPSTNEAKFIVIFRRVEKDNE